MTIIWEDLLHDNYTSPEEMIIGMHHEENMTIDEISEKLGISHTTLKRKIVALGIRMKPKGGIAFSKQGKKGKVNHV
jgi:predicted ArsR family transcriptional regulator